MMELMECLQCRIDRLRAEVEMVKSLTEVCEQMVDALWEVKAACQGEAES